MSDDKKQVPRTVSPDIDYIALETARKIEDLYCASYHARAQRLAAIQVAVADALTQLWKRRMGAIESLTVEEAQKERFHGD